MKRISPYLLAALIVFCFASCAKQDGSTGAAVLPAKTGLPAASARPPQPSPSEADKNDTDFFFSYGSADQSEQLEVYATRLDTGNEFPYAKRLVYIRDGMVSVAFTLQSESRWQTVDFADFDGDGIAEIVFCDEALSTRYDPGIIYVFTPTDDGAFDALLVVADQTIESRDILTAPYKAVLLEIPENRAVFNDTDNSPIFCAGFEIVEEDDRPILKVDHHVGFPDSVEKAYTLIAWQNGAFEVVGQGTEPCLDKFIRKD